MTELPEPLRDDLDVLRAFLDWALRDPEAVGALARDVTCIEGARSWDAIELMLRRATALLGNARAVEHAREALERLRPVFLPLPDGALDRASGELAALPADPVLHGPRLMEALDEAVGVELPQNADDRVVAFERALLLSGLRGALNEPMLQGTHAIGRRAKAILAQLKAEGLLVSRSGRLFAVGRVPASAEERAYAAIRAAIDTSHPVGSMLPGTAVLAARLGLQDPHVTRVLRRLEAERVLVRAHTRRLVLRSAAGPLDTTSGPARFATTFDLGGRRIDWIDGTCSDAEGVRLGSRAAVRALAAIVAAAGERVGLDEARQLAWEIAELLGPDAPLEVTDEWVRLTATPVAFAPVVELDGWRIDFAGYELHRHGRPVTAAPETIGLLLSVLAGRGALETLERRHNFVTRLAFSFDDALRSLDGPLLPFDLAAVTVDGTLVLTALDRSPLGRALSRVEALDRGQQITAEQLAETVEITREDAQSLLVRIVGLGELKRHQDGLRRPSRPTPLQLAGLYADWIAAHHQPGSAVDVQPLIGRFRSTQRVMEPALAYLLARGVLVEDEHGLRRSE